MAALAEAHWSVIRALVAAVASGLNGRGRRLSRAAAEGWTLLSALDAERPEAVREVLTYPFVQAWATQCLRPAEGADRDLDRAHLAGLAAAAALRAGIETELVLPVREGSIYLPAVGALAVGADAGRTSAVRVSASGLALRGGVRGWRSVRRVTTGGNVGHRRGYRPVPGLPGVGRGRAAAGGDVDDMAAGPGGGGPATRGGTARLRQT